MTEMDEYVQISQNDKPVQMSDIDKLLMSELDE